GFTLPAIEYDHGEGCSITGGYVYRGTALPELQGRYLYSDFCGGFLRSLRYDGGAVVERVEWIPSGIGNIQSFGQDGAGNLYLLLRTGRIMRVERG
ncbi:MAG TPA: glucose dehydrogenase, partial [Burkholderiaceae bacterium]|nr:glucose dehydrogenase [Burkholderiaceae bacterium]